MQDGHVVRIGVHRKHRESVEAQGCESFPIEGFDPEQLMANKIVGGGGVGFSAIESHSLYAFWYADVCRTTWAAATQPRPDGSKFRAEIIFSSHQQQAALPVAERLGAELFFFNTYPMTPTKAFRHPYCTFVDGRDSPETPIVNQLTYWAYDNATHLCIAQVMGDFRQALGLRRSNAGYRTTFQELIMKMRLPCFCVWSPSLLPKPDDWHENIVVCGNVDRTGGLPPLPADLVDFCRAGQAPVFFGFGPGSMSREDLAQRAWDSALACIRNLQCRAILHVTPEFRHCISSVPDGAFLLDRPVPHSSLFELCSIAVHHGGPGTLAAALRAGIPNCIVSFVCDNPFWGDRLQNLNVGSHVPSRAVNGDRLTELVRRLYAPDVKAACRTMQKSMLREEEGTEVLVRELYRRLPASGPVSVDWATRVQSSGARGSALSMKNVLCLLLLLLAQAAWRILADALRLPAIGALLVCVALMQYYDKNVLAPTVSSVKALSPVPCVGFDKTKT